MDGFKEGSSDQWTQKITDWFPEVEPHLAAERAYERVEIDNLVYCSGRHEGAIHPEHGPELLLDLQGMVDLDSRVMEHADEYIDQITSQWDDGELGDDEFYATLDALQTGRTMAHHSIIISMN